MVRGVTLTTTMNFVKTHPDEIRQLTKGFVDAIHFFRTRKRETLEILKEHAAPILKLQTDEEVETLYEEWAQSLETKPYPSLQAISNVFSSRSGATPRSEATTRSACGILTLSEN